MSGLIIDKPPIATTPPELPPYLRPKRRPERRVIIVPDIRCCEQRTIVFDQQNNWQTLVYQWMNRITGDGLFDPAAKWEIAHAHSRRYRQWLETYDLSINGGIPPHISFGGAIVTGKGDPTFKSRWQDYAKETFF